jgi:hypothetical protein
MIGLYGCSKISSEHSCFFTILVSCLKTERGRNRICAWNLNFIDIFLLFIDFFCNLTQLFIIRANRVIMHRLFYLEIWICACVIMCLASKG